ncbi:hypothetical protein NtRootA9_37210 [Arthrobacter sp. NtRootA9]|nr:hypothetical protein NtRootA9_37210 [Arthrobacter sp. NtRootA9]
MDDDIYLLGGVELDGLRQLLVGGPCAQAADKGKDGALRHGKLLGGGPVAGVKSQGNAAFTQTKRTAVRLYSTGLDWGL